MNTLFTTTTYIAWGILFCVWSYFGFDNKKTIQRENYTGWAIMMTIALAGFILLFFPYLFGSMLSRQIYRPTLVTNIGGLGVHICGVLFAIWARLTIGTNWSGAIITLKDDHELVTSGPYAFVRHPIYTGWLMAALGTALTIGTWSALIAVILIKIAFLIRIPKEEALMTAQFGDVYREYQKRTKRLVPFVW